MTFVETKLFTELVQDYLSDDEYAAMQQFLVVNPEAGTSFLPPAASGNFGGASLVVANEVACA